MESGIDKLTPELEKLLTISHQVKEYQKGDYLFREGEAVKGLYILRSGKVQIGKVTPDGRELALKICGTGQMVGEITVFAEGATYLLDARALTKTVCLKIPVEELEQSLEKDPALAMAFMKWMGIDQRKTQTRFRDLMLHGKKGALYSTLIRLGNSYGVEAEGGLLIDILLTNQELANFCGMSREMVNRMLSDLRKQGTVGMKDGKIVLYNIPKLKFDINCEECPIYLCKID